MSILGGLIFQPETSSTVITEIITKTTSSVLMSNSVSSGQNNTATNNINISDITAGANCSLDIKTTQKTLQKPDFTGMSDSSQSSAINTAIKGALKENIQKTNRGIQLMSSPQNSESITTSIDEIANNVSQMSIVSCLQNNTATNDLNIENIKTNCPAICGRENLTFTQFFTVTDFDALCTTPITGTQEIIQAAVAKCIANNKQVTDSINELARELTKDASQETVGLDPEGVIEATGGAVAGTVGAAGKAASGILESAQTTLIVLGIVGLIIGAIFLYFYMQE